MRYESELILPLVQKGNTIQIKSTKNFPNVPKKIKVDYITNNGFVYNVSSTCDGYTIPFYMIDSFKIL